MFFKFRKKKFLKGESLEIDEILFDSHQLGQKDLKWENRIEKPVLYSNIKIFGAVIFFILLVIVFRSFYIVLAGGDSYFKKAQSNYIKEIWERAPRGIIYDSKNRPIVKNISSFNLVAIPAEIPRDKKEQLKIITLLSQLLKKDENEIKEQFEKIDRFSYRPILVLEDLTHEESLIFKSNLEELPGFRLEENFKRYYGEGGVFSHVLGYTGRVVQEDIKENPNYLLTDTIGKNGIEFYYEKYLRGKHGVVYLETRAEGGKSKEIETEKSVPGNNLHLFLDKDLQEKLTEIMKNTLAQRGMARAAAVAMDPKSGGILAMQSFPLFDANVFGSRLSMEDYKNIFENEYHPLFNRVVSGVYPPGSTIKPFIGVAALQEKVIDDKTTINDEGKIIVGTQEFKGWTPLGVVDIYKAISMSSNIFFYTVGGGYGNIRGLGPYKLEEYLKKFRFGFLTNIDYPGESEGLIPGPEWKKEVRGETWFIGDTYNTSIGQGYTQVSPLQLAVATASIANGGVILKPRIVKSITDSQGNVIENLEPEILSKDFVDAEALSIIRKAMHENVLSGSGKILQNVKGSAGGKTGTAQTGVGNIAHAWFTVFAPYDDPKIVLTVLVESVGEGPAIAVPIARDVLEWYLGKE